MGEMVFVPDGQHDSSQGRSAWNHEENSSVPAGRLNRSRLRLDASSKNLVGRISQSIRNRFGDRGSARPRMDQIWALRWRLEKQPTDAAHPLYARLGFTRCSLIHLVSSS
jgi:hypothetical protein